MINHLIDTNPLFVLIVALIVFVFTLLDIRRIDKLKQDNWIAVKNSFVSPLKFRLFVSVAVGLVSLLMIGLNWGKM